MAICGLCKAQVIFAVHERTGNEAPLDAEPTDDGRWHIVEQLDLNGDINRIYAHGERGGHTSHFATCPHAESYRRQRKFDETEL